MKKSRLSLVDGQVIKSGARVMILGIVLAAIALSTACTRFVIYPSEETATAQAKIATMQASGFTETPTAFIMGGGDPVQTPEDPGPTAVAINETPIPTLPSATEKPPLLYHTMSGDTLAALCTRFNVEPGEIISPDMADLPDNQLLPPDLLLIIPDRLSDTSPEDLLIPDSEIIDSASAIDFNTEDFVGSNNGYLTSYSEWCADKWCNGAQIVERVAYENSINPRLLLAVLEIQSHWVTGQPSNLAEIDYPIGWRDFNYRQLYKQLSWAVEQLSIGYYGWRAGSLTEVTFTDGSSLRLAPELNAGTVALQYLFSRLYNQNQWNGILYSNQSFPALYEQMFGNAWMRAQAVEPLFPINLTQPEFQLPFKVGKTWNFTGGPHPVWGAGGVLGALDFAPPSDQPGCVVSDEWVTASAAGLVVRSYNGIVIIDLDGDGYEQTGWVLFYLHIASKGRVSVGTWLNAGDPIGHPSCEGGSATGTHTHMARKYNGEWIPADGPLPFVLSGWQAHNGSQPYEGTLTRDDKTVTAHVYSSFDTAIKHEADDPGG
jgi:LasA protease